MMTTMRDDLDYMNDGNTTLHQGPWMGGEMGDHGEELHISRL